MLCTIYTQQQFAAKTKKKPKTTNKHVCSYMQLRVMTCKGVPESYLFMIIRKDLDKKLQGNKYKDA